MSDRYHVEVGKDRAGQLITVTAEKLEDGDWSITSERGYPGASEDETDCLSVGRMRRTDFEAGRSFGEDIATWRYAIARGL